jgi:hypothetical protein
VLQQIRPGLGWVRRHEPVTVDERVQESVFPVPVGSLGEAASDLDALHFSEGDRHVLERPCEFLLPGRKKESPISPTAFMSWKAFSSGPNHPFSESGSLRIHSSDDLLRKVTLTLANPSRLLRFDDVIIWQKTLRLQSHDDLQRRSHQRTSISKTG